MSNQSASDESFDLTQFYGIFFEEAAEHLDSMEALLLGIDIAAADDEQLNAIFRAAHSIKGGAATFGFKDITELTHEMETVFDLVRKGKMALTTDLVDAFLASGDMLKSMLSARREGGSGLEGPAVQRELALIKVSGTGDKRMESLRIAEIFRARVVDSTNTSFVFELTGSAEKLNAFIDLMRPLGLVDVSRTGIVAISRGPNPL